MKYFKTYIFQIVISIIFLLIMFFIYNSQSAPTIKQDIVDYNSYWTINIDNDITKYKELPREIKNNSLKSITFEKVLPKHIKNGDAILFFTSHHKVEVYVDQILIYQFKEPARAISKTPGNAWHHIRLDSESKLDDGYSGAKIKIVIEPCYSSVSGYVPAFQYGMSDSLIGTVIKESVFSLLLCAILFIIGIFILIGTVFFNKQLRITKSLIWLGLFSVMVSLWSITDITVLPLFIGNHLLINQIAFISLKLLLIPLVIFSQEIYGAKKKKLINVLCILSIIDFFTTVSLQMFGILDFKETVIFVHLLFLIAAVSVVFININYLIKGEKKLKKTMQVHLISIIVLAVCASVDLTIYYTIYVRESGGFTKIGLLFYILVLLYLAVNNSIKLMNSNEQLDRMKEFAKRDAITQLSNRSAFQEDIYAIKEDKYSNYSVAVFDLNNLKQFNDQYGHSMGDYYIIISSEIIQDMFGKNGKVYRVGGDEFCAIMKNVPKVVFTDLEANMNQRLDSLNGMFFEIKMSIASGYAAYDPDQDMTIYDTFQRADKNMYKHKSKMKHRI